MSLIGSSQELETSRRERHVSTVFACLLLGASLVSVRADETPAKPAKVDDRATIYELENAVITLTADTRIKFEPVMTANGSRVRVTFSSFTLEATRFKLKTTVGGDGGKTILTITADKTGKAIESDIQHEPAPSVKPVPPQKRP